MSVVASVIAENIDAGSIELLTLTEHVALLSEPTVPLDAGTYVRNVEWSIGGIAVTSPETPALVEIRARAAGLLQIAQFRVAVV